MRISTAIVACALASSAPVFNASALHPNRPSDGGKPVAADQDALEPQITIPTVDISGESERHAERL